MLCPTQALSDNEKMAIHPSPIPIQKIDAVTLSYLARELRGMLLGARVSRITHPAAKEFVISFWGHAHPANAEDAALLIPRGELNHFYINLHPEFCYALLLEPGEKDALIKTTLDHPTAVCMLLRKHLGNATVSDVFVLPHERVLNLCFENFNELGNRVKLILSIELMGKTSNMVLYDELQEEILALSHSVSEKMSQYREMTVGSTYIPPPLTRGKTPISQFSDAEFEALLTTVSDTEINANTLAEALVQRLAGVGKMMLRQAIEISEKQAAQNKANKPQDDSVSDFSKRLYQCLIQVSPDVLQGVSSNRLQADHIAPRILFSSPSVKNKSQTPIPAEFSLLPDPGRDLLDDAQAFSTVHEMLRAYFLPRTAALRLEEFRTRLLASVETAQRRRLKREQSLSPDAGDIEVLQHAGHLMLAAANSGGLQGERPAKGLALVTDYQSGEEISLEVDPSLSWMENAERYYRRAKKAKARQAQFVLQQEQLSREAAYLEELALMIAQADTLKMLQVMADELDTFLREKKQKAESLPSAEGLNRSSGNRKSLNFKQKAAKSQKKPKQKASQGKTPPGLITLPLEAGGQILVGRSGQANGELVGRLGKPNDWWFHVHQMPGSHVVLRHGELKHMGFNHDQKGNDEPEDALTANLPLDPQQLLLAANLAVYFSTARESKNVPVIYTQIKHVRKIPGSYPGHVTYKHEQSVFITVDEALIKSALGIG
ncbi:MAG: NFACT family protein [Vampirovibrionales bacterium]|nr:NFACT family protein [Vampirovibrionales bacterium]